MYRLGGGIKWLLIYARLLISISTNLIVQASYIPGHEIYIVSYAYLDGGNY